MSIEKYFINTDTTVKTKIGLLISDRLRRIYIGKSNLVLVSAGDVVALVFWNEALIYRFEGICISIRYKSLKNINSNICLRNVLFGIGIEITASYFMNRVYYLTILDYKRKQFLYRRSKLYYLRTKLNRASRVKQ